MGTRTKTWKIGEYCKGGVITVEVDDADGVCVIGKEWDFSTGSRKGSCQKNAKPFCSQYFTTTGSGWQWGVEAYLSDLTACYYSDIIMDWIKSKTFEE